MKTQDFKAQLRQEVNQICLDNRRNFEEPKHRGMAFEDWCFQLLAQKYPTHENDKDESIIRSNDGGIDIFFESGETKELYILQCKFHRTSNINDIDENELKQFFSNFELYKNPDYVKSRDSKNSILQNLSHHIKYCIQNGYTINFVFVSTDKITQKTDALKEQYLQQYRNSGININFLVWGIAELKSEWEEISKQEEEYPERVMTSIGSNHYLKPEGKVDNLTFAIRGTELQRIAKQHRESLFNWNIRRYLGKKGDVNQGIIKTISEEPENFYYFNNGISALCESFDFDEGTKNLKIDRLQIVNGAQTVGAIQVADPDKLKDVLVLVKLTAIKKFQREKGIAADLIRTNNTQNKLSIPDFRSNDQIQLWLEQKFKDTKGRGELKPIDYGRKRPYPRASAYKQVIRLQDLAKIRFAWLKDPRIPLAEPAKLFELGSDNGLYDFAFGDDGTPAEHWSDEQFQETLLAVHTYNKLMSSLDELQQSEPEYRQIGRLKYYALHLFKIYLEKLDEKNLLSISRDELCRFGERYNSVYKEAAKLIILTLKQAYKEILNREEGTAFSLPRDTKVWNLVQNKFSDNLEIKLS